MRSAYSRTLRSLENGPMPTVLSTARAAPLLGLPIQRIDAILRLAVRLEVREHEERLAIRGQAVDQQPRVVGSRRG